MSFLLILPINRAGGGAAREELVRRYRLDYTHVLQMTFDLWEVLESGDREAIQAALEYYLHRRLSRRHTVSFEDMFQAVHLAVSAVGHFYETIQPHLQEILDRHIHPTTPQLELKGWLSRTPVIQVSLKNEAIPNVHCLGFTHQRGVEGVPGYRDVLVFDGSGPQQPV